MHAPALALRVDGVYLRVNAPSDGRLPSGLPLFSFFCFLFLKNGLAPDLGTVWVPDFVLNLVPNLIRNFVLNLIPHLVSDLVPNLEPNLGPNFVLRLALIE